LDKHEGKKLKKLLQTKMASKLKEAEAKLEEDIENSKKALQQKMKVQALQEEEFVLDQVGSRPSLGLDNESSVPLVLRLEEYIAVIYVANLHLSGLDEIAIETVRK
jgi:hypothetical protein